MRPRENKPPMWRSACLVALLLVPSDALQPRMSIAPKRPRAGLVAAAAPVAVPRACWDVLPARAAGVSARERGNTRGAVLQRRRGAPCWYAGVSKRRSGVLDGGGEYGRHARRVRRFKTGRAF